VFRAIGRIVGFGALLGVLIYVLIPAYTGMTPWHVRGGDEPRAAHLEELARKLSSSTFPMTRNSDEASKPFKSASGQGEPGWLYWLPIKRFPDTRSCLTAPQRRVETPDLLAFDWAAMSSGEAVEVCLFRVLSSIGSVEGARHWFHRQGYSTTEPVPSFRDPDRIVALNAGRLFSYEVAPKWPSWGLQKWRIWSTAHSETLVIRWSRDGELISVDTSWTTL
jgi:hypothetical protein